VPTGVPPVQADAFVLECTALASGPTWRTDLTIRVTAEGVLRSGDRFSVGLPGAVDGLSRCRVAAEVDGTLGVRSNSAPIPGLDDEDEDSDAPPDAEAGAGRPAAPGAPANPGPPAAPGPPTSPGQSASQGPSTNAGPPANVGPPASPRRPELDPSGRGRVNRP
jgi:hypothetical protein